MAVAFLCAYVPLLGSISVLIAGLVTLRKGALDGALVLLAATIPYLLSYYMAPPPSAQAAIANISLAAIIASNLLVWLFAIVLQRRNNWGLLLDLSVLPGALLVGAIHLFYGNIQDWWAVQLTAWFAKTADIAGSLPVVNIHAQSQAIDIIKHYATGLIITSILLNSLLQLALARWWEGAVFNLGRLREALYQLRLSYTAGILFIVILVLSFWQNNVISDIRPVFYGIFCLAGLSLAHCLFSTIKYAWFWLILFYTAVTFTFPQSIIIIAMIALLDVLLNFRKKMPDNLMR
jgi:hypothetical protein